MRIGIFGGDAGSEGRGIDQVVDGARRAREDGFASYWVPQIFGYDGLTALAVVGREVPDIELGTGVVPTYPRHPMMIAGQALTVQACSGNRLALGIGLSHQFVIEHMFGMSFAKPVGHMKDYLSILRPLLHGESVAYRGEHLSTNGGLSIPGVTAPPILVAALGTQMLRLSARMAEGTVTWMTGPATLAEHIVPTITSAAKEAGRDAPRVVAALPVCVTSDPAAARERAAAVFSIYGQLPSYRAMLDREGAAGPADVAIVGDADTVIAELRRVADTGITDFSAVEFGADEAERTNTRDVLRSLL